MTGDKHTRWTVREVRLGKVVAYEVWSPNGVNRKTFRTKDAADRFIEDKIQ